MLFDVTLSEDILEFTQKYPQSILFYNVDCVIASINIEECRSVTENLLEVFKPQGTEFQPKAHLRFFHLT